MESSEIRAAARAHLAGKWPISIGIAAVACLLGGMVAGQSFLPNLEVQEEVESVRSLNLEYLISAVVSLLAGDGILGLVQFVIGGVVELGHAKILLKQHDGQEYTFTDLFSQFDRFTVGFMQSLLRNLYILLWSLLLIIPGIVASYRYSMTPFILAEHPELTASQAIAKSKAMMDGHKGELFFLDLSFIGWDILCMVTMNLGYLVLNPYRNAAHAVFYRNLTRAEPVVY